MNIPADLKYTNDHEWTKIEENIVIVGITDYAQGELGDIVYVELPSVGDEVACGEGFGTIEAVKAVSDLIAPLSGIVSEVNEALADEPEVVNGDPYGDGWMIKIDISAGNSSELDELLAAEDYSKLLNS